ncbi:hypothetical protein [Bacteroides helcogenes]|nr:hypothetical protein [Bacteroides helcogenes]MDY5238212.1 hypothetical protein [Bacteroides helcogenes]
MKKNGFFNLQEKNTSSIFAVVTETQTPFCRMNNTQEIAAEVF